MKFGYPRGGTVLGFKGQSHRLNRCILHQCPKHNSKTNDPKVFKLDVGIRMTLGYLASDMVLGWKVKGQH